MERYGLAAACCCNDESMVKAYTERNENERSQCEKCPLHLCENLRFKKSEAAHERKRIKLRPVREVGTPTSASCAGCWAIGIEPLLPRMLLAEAAGNEGAELRPGANIELRAGSNGVGNWPG
jgi:hypothetical protein